MNRTREGGNTKEKVSQSYIQVKLSTPSFININGISVID